MHASNILATASAVLAAAVLGSVALSTFATPSGAAAPLPLAGGPTPIDSLPYVITSGGAYCVTKNLVGPAGSHGIVVEAAQVTLDLGGFRLTGLEGSFDGIHSVGFGNVKISNGWLSGWGESAIECGGSTTISDVDATDCGDVAFKSIGAVVLERLSTFANAAGDVDAGPRSHLRDCVFRSSIVNPTSVGVRVGSKSDVANVDVVQFGTGIVVGNYSQVSNCRVTDADSTGVVAFDRCRITGVMVHEGLGRGISVNNECVVVDNFCSGLGAEGIYVNGARNVVEGNVSTSNGVGIRALPANNLVIANRTYDNTTEDIISPVPNPTGSINREFWWIGGKDPHTNFATPIF